MKRNLLISLIFIGFFYVANAHAWCHEVAIAYGSGNEIDQPYRNQGVILLGKWIKLPKIDETLIATIDVSASEFHAATQENKVLRTLAIAISPRAYFFPPELSCIRPYLGTSIGPCYLSSKKFGTREQGGHAAFQITLESGIEINCWDINLRLIHFCNAGLFDPNEAINLFPTLSIGYMFG